MVSELFLHSHVVLSSNIPNIYSVWIMLFGSSHALALDMVKDGTLVRLRTMHVELMPLN